MTRSTVHLPNGQTLAVSTVFGGIAFKSNELANQRSAFPPGWTVVLNEEDEEEFGQPLDELEPGPTLKKHHIHRYKRPSLHSDHLYISSISYPSSSEFKPATSPTRQIAMMLWATLWWYFHQPEPEPQLVTSVSSKTPEAGRPKGEWRININREGIFKGKNLLAKLERMGLISSEDSCVGVDERNDVGTTTMFVSRRAFWQMDPRIFLFTLSPVANSPFAPASPFGSRPSSPKRPPEGRESPTREKEFEAIPKGAITPPGIAGPFQSKSNLPTYYPPHPVQYTFTNAIRHPIRPRPFRQGETIYCRYVPSLGQWLSFRIASMSFSAPSQHGPWSPGYIRASISTTAGTRSPPHSNSDSVIPTISSLGISTNTNDIELLHNWMNNPRVAHAWGEDGPQERQEEFLRKNLKSQHSFPVIGCWDGKPFGYFEIYWVKEDVLGKYLGGEVDDWDRGLHCLVGEEEYRGPHRVQVWLSALIHYCLIADMRTNTIMMEPRVDNTKLEKYCLDAGFHKEREISFPHKQSNLMKINRSRFTHPAI